MVAAVVSIGRGSGAVANCHHWQLSWSAQFSRGSHQLSGETTDRPHHLNTTERVRERESGRNTSPTGRAGNLRVNHARKWVRRIELPADGCTLSPTRSLAHLVFVCGVIVAAN